MILDEYICNWDCEEEYAAFCVTENLNTLLAALDGRLKLKYIIDNSVQKQGTHVNNIPVVSFNVLAAEKNNVIIANENSPAVRAIKTQLTEAGFAEDVNFTSYRKLISAWKMHYEEKIAATYVEIMITSKCTLACKDCGLLLPYFKNPSHRQINDVLRDIDLYFQAVDFVSDFHILGGEPLLHPDIDKIMAYICDSYRDKIGILQIITNGTLIPEDDFLKSCANNNVMFRISNYSNTLRGKRAYNVSQLTDALDKNGVKYNNVITSKWLSLGNVNEKQRLSTKALSERFYDCMQPCRALYNGRLYFCGPMCAAVYAGIYEPVETDCIDLTRIQLLDRRERASQIIDFDLGKHPAGFCDCCNGMGSLNKNPVQAAVQVSKNER